MLLLPLLMSIENNTRTVYQTINIELFFRGAIIGSATDGCIYRFFPTIHFFVESIALLTTLSTAFCPADVAPFPTAFPTFCDVEVAPFTTASTTL